MYAPELFRPRPKAYGTCCGYRLSHRRSADYSSIVFDRKLDRSNRAGRPVIQFGCQSYYRRDVRWSVGIVAADFRRLGRDVVEEIQSAPDGDPCRESRVFFRSVVKR